MDGRTDGRMHIQIQTKKIQYEKKVNANHAVRVRIPGLRQALRDDRWCQDTRSRRRKPTPIAPLGDCRQKGVLEPKFYTTVDPSKNVVKTDVVNTETNTCPAPASVKQI